MEIVVVVVDHATYAHKSSYSYTRENCSYIDEQLLSIVINTT